MEIKNYNEVIGEVVKEVYVGEYETSLLLEFESGNGLLLTHYQDCCEYVAIDDIVGGKLEDLKGQKILKFEEVINIDLDEKPKNLDIDEEIYSSTWTFYKISTFKDDITIRWFGTSNGWYSEKVDVEHITDEDKLKSIKKNYFKQ